MKIIPETGVHTNFFSNSLKYTLKNMKTKVDRKDTRVYLNELTPMHRKYENTYTLTPGRC